MTTYNLKLEKPKFEEKTFFVNNDNKQYILSKYIPNYDKLLFNKNFFNKDFIFQEELDNLDKFNIIKNEENNIIDNIIYNNNQINILNNEEISNLFYKYRKLKNDENTFYRILIFFYFENIFINNNDENLKNIICDIIEKYHKNKILKKYYNDNNIHLSDIINPLCIIYLRLYHIIYNNDTNNELESPFFYFIKAYNNYKNFDIGLILYIKILFYEFIENNIDNIVSEKIKKKLILFLKLDRKYNLEKIIFHESNNNFIEKLIILAPYILNFDLNYIKIDKNIYYNINILNNYYESQKIKLFLLKDKNNFYLYYNKDFKCWSFDDKSINLNNTINIKSEIFNKESIKSIINSIESIKSKNNSNNSLYENINLNYPTTFNKKENNLEIMKISNNNKNNIINTNLLKNNKKIKTNKSFNNFYKIDNIFDLNENEIINDFNNIIRNNYSIIKINFNNKKNSENENNLNQNNKLSNNQKCENCNINMSNNIYNICNICLKKEIENVFSILFKKFKNIKNKDENFLKFYDDHQNLIINNIKTTIDEAISKYNQNEKSELLLIKKLIENNN